MSADGGLNDFWALGHTDEEAIHGFPSSVYDYQKSMEDLKHSHLYNTVELESLRNRTNIEMRRAEEELRRKEEQIDELTRQLKITAQERDEARYQLQMLLKIAKPTKAAGLHPESPQFRPTRGGSSITESDSQGSYVSSPLFDPVTSTAPELSNMNMADSYNVAPYRPFFPRCNVADYDQGSAIVDRLAMMKGLPERGKLLEAVQAVTRATPLLETLLLIGPLPRWRNPPPLQVVDFQIPSAAVEVRGAGMLDPTAVVNPKFSVRSGWQHEKSQVGSHLSVTPMDLCTTRRGVLSYRPIHGRSSAEKRQRPQ